MNIPKLLSSFAAWILIPAFAAAMSNQDVIKMHKAGLSDETILAAIQKEAKDYSTSAADLIDLKEAGVSEKIIQTIIATGNGPAESTATYQTSSPRVPAATTPPDTTSAAVTAADTSAAFQQDFPSIAPEFIAPVVGQNYFTRYTFHAEGGEHITTNYARGAAIPINTPVTLVSKSGSRLVIKRTDTGDTITFKNEEKYSRKSIDEIARLLLSSEKTPLERLPEEVAAAVRNGEMRRGMTKELVLMTRGYPPAHETPSPATDDRWVYWSSRFVKHTMVFTGGRLSEGRGIH